MARGVRRWATGALVAASLLTSASCTTGSTDPGTSTPTDAPSPTGDATTTCSMKTDDAASQTHAAFFAGVDAAGPKDVWAVGTLFDVSRPGPLIQRWDGSTWKSMLHQGDREHGLQLSDVAAHGPNDVWAVGFVPEGASALHWDGSRLTQVSTAPALGRSNLLGVTVLGPQDVWAVGISPGGRGYQQTLIQHMSGSRWTVASAPDTGGYTAGLRDVDGRGADSLWAVGWTVGDDQVYRPLVERHVGDGWVIVPTPHLADDATLSGVAVAGPKDVWAVGWSWNEDASRSLVLHWNGSVWRVLHVSGDTGSTAHLATVALDGSDVIVAGQAPDADGVLQPVAFRLRGSTWTSHATPGGVDGGGFQGITTVDGVGMMAVGIQWGSAGYTTLVQSGC